VEVIPAIDLLGGRVVRLLRGDYQRATVYAHDPVALAQTMREAGVTRLHVVDLDAARDPAAGNRDLVARLAGLPGLAVEVGGGIRDRAAAARWFDLGVRLVILGTLAAEQPEAAIAIAEEWPRRVLVGLDVRGTTVATRGWLTEGGDGPLALLRRFAGAPLGGVVHTRIERDGTLEGIDAGGLAEVVAASPHPVIASGGVAGLADVEAARAAGAAGVIVGKAYYEGRLDLSAAIALASAGEG
jgi:phosphoribosylformimino-5-aminoimidazole carboxamide ribotide isomerase